MIFNEMRKMWVSNGNKLSNQYTGTDSNITGVIETGKQGITGKLSQMFTGVQRFIKNNFSDQQKHDSIRIILNQHPNQQPYGQQRKLEEKMKENRHQFEK